MGENICLLGSLLRRSNATVIIEPQTDNDDALVMSLSDDQRHLSIHQLVIFFSIHLWKDAERAICFSVEMVTDKQENNYF